jgi:RNA polymerase sigma-70 factor (ECF subfamily)
VVLHEKPDLQGTAQARARPWPTFDRGSHDGAQDGASTEALGPDPQEQATVARARAGDPDACRELVERHQDRIFRLALRVLRCDRATAEDMCQEVFLRAFRALGRFDGAVKFGTWLHTITMNACISEFRKLRTLKRDRATVSIDEPLRGTEDLRLEPPSKEVDPGARADQKEFAASVRMAVHELPEEFRHAVLLRDMQGLAYEEIGAILGVPPGTVRSRIHRGRLILQEKLRGFA